jgi:DNA-binding NtrC family response regulator
MSHRVLIVDDEAGIRQALKQVLEYEDLVVRVAASGGEAITVYSEFRPQLVFLDVKMAGLDGLETLSRLRGLDPRAQIVMISGHGTIATAVEATQRGAFDFLEKPLDTDRLLLTVRNALAHAELVGENARLREAAESRYQMVGTSPALEAVRVLVAKVGPTAARVLITGENGTGKELVARAIHANSPRAREPFIEVNCAAIPAELIESELFGHMKGSFTGASDKHLGKFQEANGGTLFLDEVGELPLDIQVKLLRALQESEIDPIGSKRPVKVDVRILSATNRDLTEEVKEGRFREDLFYRLNVYPIEAPALRDRREDIPALVEHFIHRFNVEEGKRIAGASPETMKCLTAYDWPGNVRQLENAVYRAIVLADAPYLQPHDFPAISGVKAPPMAAVLPVEALPATPTPQQLMATLPQDVPVKVLDERGHLSKLEDIERDLIQLAIEIYAGHMSEVARRLGIGRSTLYRKVREQGLDVDTAEAG